MSVLTYTLEGDGAIENLYHFLWTRDELGAERARTCQR